MHTRRMLHCARHLRLYSELESYLGDFVRGRYGFIWVTGRPGVGKSESIRTEVRGQEVYYRTCGQLTPIRFYTDLYRHRGQPVILDDAEHLLANPIGAKLVSALADSVPVKQMCYGTTSMALGDVPETLQTTSRLCIIANTPTTHEAIWSRAVPLYFDPTDLEIHKAAAHWYWDQEIHDWFGQHLQRLPQLEARWYAMASQDKTAGRDWRRLVLESHTPSRAEAVVQDLESEPAYPTREDRARRFVELMGTAKGASRASYFRLRRRLEEEGRLVPQIAPPIPLRYNRPPTIPSLVELEAMGAARSLAPEPDAHPADLPAHGAFARPIRGQGQAGPARPVLDDTVAWETPPTDGDGEE